MEEPGVAAVVGLPEPKALYTFMIVEVTGRNLEPVVHAISYGNCGCIREFHPKLYDRPAPGEPVIETIHITAADEKLS